MTAFLRERQRRRLSALEARAGVRGLPTVVVWWRDLRRADAGKGLLSVEDSAEMMRMVKLTERERIAPVLVLSVPGAPGQTTMEVAGP